MIQQIAVDGTQKILIVLMDLKICLKVFELFSFAADIIIKIDSLGKHIVFVLISIHTGNEDLSCPHNNRTRHEKDGNRPAMRIDDSVLNSKMPGKPAQMHQPVEFPFCVIRNKILFEFTGYKQF